MKTFKKIMITLLVLTAAYLSLMFYAFHPQEGKKYFFPEGYRGWVCITYEKKGFPALKIEGDALILKIPKNGILETSSRLTIVENPNKYHVPTYSEYYYYSDKGNKEAKKMAMGGGRTTHKKGSKEFTSYFWISTKEKIESDSEKYVKGRDVFKDPVCGEWEK